MLVFRCHTSDICSNITLVNGSHSSKSKDSSASNASSSSKNNKKSSARKYHRKSAVAVKCLNIRDFYKRKPRRKSAVIQLDVRRGKGQKKKKTANQEEKILEKKNAQYLESLGLKVKKIC